MWPSSTQQLLAIAGDEVAPLLQALRDFPGEVVLRGVDGRLLPLIQASGSSCLPDGPTMSAPVYDTDGALLAALELVSREAECAHSAETILRSMLQVVARSMTERWFRICHRRDWIVAARRDLEPHSLVIVAVDEALRLLGADYQARQLLAARGQEFARGLTLSMFFQADGLSLVRQRYCDVMTKLPDSEERATWSVLITPPHFGASQLFHNERLLLHTRPRVDSIGRPSPQPREDEVQGGLRPWMLRRAEQYIDAHLGSVLNVDKLASHLGISISHFTRCFRAAVGLSPHSYITQRRLQRAQEMLAQTDMALAHIAVRTGFADQSHFSRRFRQHTGLCPKAFRALHR